MGYIKPLDGIRAIAVLLVIIWHWVPRNSLLENLQAGSLGVNIFFVLSGFLITEILLSHRKRTDGSNRSKQKVLKNFYVRRLLRIVPVYYFCIMLVIVLNHRLSLGVTKKELLADVFYTSNFFIYFNKTWPLASLHFWSLAVEEQFYLVWPLLMLFLPKKSLLPAIAGFVCMGLISQLVNSDREFGHVLSNSCFDCFGLGGWLAFIVVYKPSLLYKSYRLLSFMSVLSIVVFILGWRLHFNIPCVRFFHAIITVAIIDHILVYRCRKSILINFLNNSVLVRIGKVSYGIYVFHMLYVYSASRLWYKYVFDSYSHLVARQYEPWIFLFLNFWILYFLAWLSWKFIEKPFLSLKRRFQYEETKKDIVIPLLEAS